MRMFMLSRAFLAELQVGQLSQHGFLDVGASHELASMRLDLFPHVPPAPRLW